MVRSIHKELHRKKLYRPPGGILYQKPTKSEKSSEISKIVRLLSEMGLITKTLAEVTLWVVFETSSKRLSSKNLY